MAQKVTAVFDIGKTNKKCFLFDQDLKEVYREYKYFEEIEDEDGYPSENLGEIQQWLKGTIDRILSSEDFNVQAVNFSSYGASFVHLDLAGKVVSPLYNYTKPLDTEITDSFYNTYGPVLDFCRVTGAYSAGMLNSGMQLYWLKYKRPEVFRKIHYSLHLPQYLSYLFTGVAVSDYTSIGCHTALWDYSKKDYHSWVYQEEINKILPPVASSAKSHVANYKGKQIKIGIGIHDSSSALLPYLRSVDKNFILLSTGTWCVALNPFSTDPLTNEDIKMGCLNYMQIDGKAVRAARLFLGQEYRLQVHDLTKYYKVSGGYYKNVDFNEAIYLKIHNKFIPKFHMKVLRKPGMPKKTLYAFENFEEAYHHLLYELVCFQAQSISRAVGNINIKRLYIDGGFTANQLFLEMLSRALPKMKIYTTAASLGSALGAALAISDTELNLNFLKEQYALQAHQPLNLK